MQVKKKALVLAEMQAFLQKRVEEDEALKNEVDAIGIQLAKWVLRIYMG